MPLTTYTVVEPGHGYSSGYTINFYHLNTATNVYDFIGFTWPAGITVVDQNTFSFQGTPVLSVDSAGVPTYGTVPVSGDQTSAVLSTSQCSFNPLTVTPYMASVYAQAATIINMAGVAVPILQEGEIYQWFFAGGSGPSMAYYDANQAAAAVTSLGRALAFFAGPDSDPAVNGGADAAFLRQRIQTHIHTCKTTMVAAVPSALMEILYSYDVNWPTVYTSEAYPFDIGGRLNNAVNLPTAYLAPGSDIDLFKIEALAWGTSYRVLDPAIVTIKFPFTVGTWPKSKCSYLVPWDNWGCGWQQEMLQALRAGVSINMWAFDHLVLLKWPVPPFPPELLQSFTT